MYERNKVKAQPTEIDDSERRNSSHSDFPSVSASAIVFIPSISNAKHNTHLHSSYEWLPPYSLVDHSAKTKINNEKYRGVPAVPGSGHGKHNNYYNTLAMNDIETAGKLNFKCFSNSKTNLFSNNYNPYHNQNRQFTAFDESTSEIKIETKTDVIHERLKRAKTPSSGSSGDVNLFTVDDVIDFNNDEIQLQYSTPNCPNELSDFESNNVQEDTPVSYFPQNFSEQIEAQTRSQTAYDQNNTIEHPHGPVPFMMANNKGENKREKTLEMGSVGLGATVTEHQKKGIKQKKGKEIHTHKKSSKIRSIERPNYQNLNSALFAQVAEDHHQQNFHDTPVLTSPAGKTKMTLADFMEPNQRVEKRRKLKQPLHQNQKAPMKQTEKKLIARIADLEIQNFKQLCADKIDETLSLSFELPPPAPPPRTQTMGPPPPLPPKSFPAPATVSETSADTAATTNVTHSDPTDFISSQSGEFVVTSRSSSALSKHLNEIYVSEKRDEMEMAARKDSGSIEFDNNNTANNVLNLKDDANNVKNMQDPTLTAKLGPIPFDPLDIRIDDAGMTSILMQSGQSLPKVLSEIRTDKQEQAQSVNAAGESKSESKQSKAKITTKSRSKTSSKKSKGKGKGKKKIKKGTLSLKTLKSIKRELKNSSAAFLKRPSSTSPSKSRSRSAGAGGGVSFSGFDSLNEDDNEGGVWPWLRKKSKSESRGSKSKSINRVPAGSSSKGAAKINPLNRNGSRISRKSRNLAYNANAWSKIRAALMRKSRKTLGSNRPKPKVGSFNRKTGTGKTKSHKKLTIRTTSSLHRMIRAHELMKTLDYLHPELQKSERALRAGRRKTGRKRKSKSIGRLH